MFKRYFDYIEEKPKEAIKIFGNIFKAFLALQGLILIIAFLLQF